MSGDEVVARILCEWAEYHPGNWRLYLERARRLIDAYHAAPQRAEQP